MTSKRLKPTSPHHFRKSAPQYATTFLSALVGFCRDETRRRCLAPPIVPHDGYAMTNSHIGRTFGVEALVDPLLQRIFSHSPVALDQNPVLSKRKTARICTPLRAIACNGGHSKFLAKNMCEVSWSAPLWCGAQTLQRAGR